MKMFFTKKDICILDPCAGGDIQYPMSYPRALMQTGVSKNIITTIDIREDSLAGIKGNYLNIECPGDFQVIITNPPFNIATDILEKALGDVKDNGFVILLLRLNFLGGKLRKHLWEDHMPKYIFVHNRRISFTADGKTDSIEYAHFVWQKGYNPDCSMLKVL